MKQIPTELDAIIDGIHEVAEQEKITPLPRPWLPPLEERIKATTIHPVNFKDEWLTEKQSLAPVIGIVDIPSMQAQEVLQLNLTQEGHVAVFSSPGYGKSTFMQTIVMDLVRVHSPERLNVYLLDFGTNGLLPLKKLPHVADTMGIDEEEKIEKFTRRIHDELKRRKKLLSEYSVASLAMYERASGKEEPIILILLDGFEALKGSKFDEILEKMITQVAREGAGIGLHLLISAGRQSAMRAALSGNIKTQVALKMIDDAEPRSIVGRTTLTIEDLPGRGLIKVEEPQLFQTALPAEGEDSLQIIEAIQEEVAQMDAHWIGERPEPIPMVPEVLDFESFKKKKQVQEMAEEGLLPLGVDYEEVNVLPFSLSHQTNLAVIGEQRKTFLPLKQSILSSIELLVGKYNTMIIDSGHICEKETLAVNAYIAESETYIQVKEDILTEIKNRKNSGSEGLPKWLIYITDIEIFEKETSLTEEELKELLLSTEETGIHFIIAGDNQYLGKTRVGLARRYKEFIKDAIFSMRITDQEFLDKPYVSREPELEIDSAYYAVEKQFIKIKHTR